MLLPFARRDWFAAAARRRRGRHLLGPATGAGTPGVWIHQCGSVDGGTRRPRPRAPTPSSSRASRPAATCAGRCPALELLEPGPGARCRADYPLLLAGGIADRRGRRPGARRGGRAPPSPAPASCSPRKSRAHPGYRRPPARRRGDHPHRAVRRRLAGARTGSLRNAATGAVAARPTVAARALNRADSTACSLRAPATPRQTVQARMVRAQRPGSRLLTPAGPTDDGPETLLDAGAALRGRDGGPHRRRRALVPRPGSGDGSTMSREVIGSSAERASVAALLFAPRVKREVM